MQQFFLTNITNIVNKKGDNFDHFIEENLFSFLKFYLFKVLSSDSEYKNLK